MLQKYLLGINFNRLDGREEDRGIEPLWLLPAVQRLASVPSAHTGSVLLNKRLPREGWYRRNEPQLVIIRTVV